MTRLNSLARAYGLDALILFCALESAAEIALRDAADAPEMSPWLAAPAVAAVALPLLARRRFPFAAPAALWAVAAGLSFADGRLIVFAAGTSIAGAAAAFLLGNLRDSFQAWTGLGVVLSATVIIVYNDPTRDSNEIVFTLAIFGIAWLAGFALRERSSQAEAAEERAALAEREREAAARVAVAEERARIARELHDIVAHAVSVMVLQVGAVRHKLPRELDEDSDALQRVEEAGRTALAEMRRLLGAMRRYGDDVDLAPQPGLDGLDALAEDVGRAGLPVRLHVEGQSFQLPRAIDLSAYRIVQEGLTNALKHAQASHADVTLRYALGGIEVEIADDGNGVATSDGLGHGLVGIRERAKIFGGDMNAGSGPGAGFVLTVRLPVDRPSA